MTAMWVPLVEFVPSNLAMLLSAMRSNISQHADRLQRFAPAAFSALQR